MFKNLVYAYKNHAKKVYILKRDGSRKFYGVITGFSFKKKQIEVRAFDFGLWMTEYYDRDDLSLK